MAERVFSTAKTSESEQKCSSSCKQKPGFDSSRSSADRILQLQRTAGNQAVQRLIKSGTLQAKLKIGQPNDIYEQEADRVAEQVMSMPEPMVRRQSEEEKEEEETIQAKPIAEQITPLVQRQVEEDEEEPVQTKLLAPEITPQLQRQPEEEEEEKEELLQTKEISEQNAEITPDLESRINTIRGGGQPLSESERAFFEPRFGYDFGQVRLHTDEKADALNRSLNARAFTTGKDIFFRQGEYNSSSSSGRGLLAHELTHVSQQTGTKRTESRIQREVTESISDCPPRADGEIEASRASSFRLRTLTDNRHYNRTWLVYDFAVGSPEFLPGKVADFEALVTPIVSRLRAPYIIGTTQFNRYLRVYGYADCAGTSGVNTSLRLGRADAFWELFPMQNRIISREGRRVGTYIESNATPLGRARNRSVKIREVGRQSPPQTRTREEIEQERGRSRRQLPNYITRARQRIQVYPGISDVQRRRISGFLGRIGNPFFNDEYLTGSLAQYYWKQNLYQISPSEIALHLETTLIDAITHSLSFDHFMDRIVSLDVTIFESIRIANKARHIYGQDFAAARRLGNWMESHQHNRSSLYNLYQ